MDELQVMARHVRRAVLSMIYRSQTSHIGSAFSCMDLLCVLYAKALMVFPDAPEAPERDRFFLSKGHACAALYAVLAERGFFDASLLDSYAQNGSILMSHISSAVPGVEFSTGSLGHALPVALGTAIAAKRRSEAWKTYVLMSDGELDEGSNWEAFLFAPSRRLDNLIAVIDKNKFQAMGRTRDILDNEDLGEKLRAFGWETWRIDGHDLGQIEDALAAARNSTNGMPKVIIADTIKGKGVSFMEDSIVWHYRAPDKDEYERAAKELGD
ncbi:MAG: transketolase [Spirochaetae bacterium HGW-Spirochaetae-9]|nr:MAG: transketolase [Spirochaetae bacterium HGW-Spirochaetae-9]